MRSGIQHTLFGHILGRFKVAILDVFQDGVEVGLVEPVVLEVTPADVEEDESMVGLDGVENIRVLAFPYTSIHPVELGFHELRPLRFA